MRLIKNTGNDRVIDELRHCLQGKSSLDIASPSFSLFAFSELQDQLANVGSARLGFAVARKGRLGTVGRRFRQGVSQSPANPLVGKAMCRMGCQKG